MRLICVYRRASDYGRSTEEWCNDFERRTGRTIEIIEPDGREGSDFCRTYDIVEYPTILALADNGQILGIWSGKFLPTFDEVNYWATQ